MQNDHRVLTVVRDNEFEDIGTPLLFNDGFSTAQYIPLTLFNPIFLPPAYSPALIYFGRERGWWVTCNYPTVLKEKNRNRKSATCAICWLKSVLHEEKLLEQENRNVGLRPTLFSQQVAQIVLFLFLFFSFKTVE
jgi:hypothetical protein